MAQGRTRKLKRPPKRPPAKAPGREPYTREELIRRKQSLQQVLANLQQQMNQVSMEIVQIDGALRYGNFEKPADVPRRPEPAKPEAEPDGKEKPTT